MFSKAYELPPRLLCDVLSQFLPAQEAILRLDERAKRSPVQDGWRERLLYHEACACQLAEGDLVHIADLVLVDAGAFNRPGWVALANAADILRAWRHALLTDDPTSLLTSNRPGLAPPVAAATATLRSDPDEQRDLIDPGRRDVWLQTVAQTTVLPPLLAAAIAWDAWLTLLPEPSGAWRAPLLAALVLRSRGMTDRFLLPIDTGRRNAPYRRHPNLDLTRRIEGFLTWAEAGAVEARKLLGSLSLTDELLRNHIKKGRRRNSRLPQLADLFIARPAVSVKLAASHLGVSQQGIHKMLPLLGYNIHPLTEDGLGRIWGISPL